MPRRSSDALYTGALGNIDARAIARLGSGHVLQPKHDGIYAVITTDSAGKISSMTMRSGTSVPQEIARDFRGVHWAPDCVLAAEIEAFTEAADRLVASRGYRCAPILDALRVAGDDVSSLPQASRRDRLFRAWAQLEDDRPWSERNRRTARKADGQWTKRIPMGHHRLPIVEQRPCSAFDEALADWTKAGAEGLVVVATGAPIGRSGAKRKHKPTSTIDCVVLSRDAYVALVSWAGGMFTVSCSGAKNAAVQTGSVVEIRHESFYDRHGPDGSIVPKFPRVNRLRPDMSAEMIPVRGLVVESRYRQ